MSNKKQRKKRAQMDNASSNHYRKYTPILGQLQEGTQNYLILKHLIDHHSITTIESFFDYGITRLSARIWDLRHMGVGIEKEMVTKKSEKGARQSYAVYRLV